MVWILRPPRRIYNPQTDLPDVMPVPGGDVMRVPFQCRNSRGQNIVGSLYPSARPRKGNPAVIYLHGNASSQEEGIYLIPFVAQIGVTLVCVDTSGSGLSDGEHIGMGYTEVDDVESVIAHIRSVHDIGPIILWGRSMGATIALWVAARRNVSVQALICDSAYVSLEAIADDLRRRGWFMRLVMPILKWVTNKDMLKNFGFGVEAVKLPETISADGLPPLLLIHGLADKLVPLTGAMDIAARWGGRCDFLLAHQDHNDNRPVFIRECSLRFIAEVLGLGPLRFVDVPEVVKDGGDAHFASPLDMLLS